MRQPKIMLHFDPEPELAEPLRNALRQFNESVIGAHRREVVLALARDEDGKLLGGVQGILMFGWLYIDRLWVSEEYRRQGLGGDLLRTIERSAAEKGARRVALLTTNWQAPEFYSKQGYETVASFDLTLDSSGGDHAAVDYLLVKQLDAPAKGGAGR
jgi:ribosomal protein S18 acetylase RimI-like enzyme